MTEQTQRKRLSELAAGESGTVLALEGGRGFVNNMKTMGILIGAVVEVKRAALSGGSVIISVGGSRLVVGHGMADKIVVKTLP